jgi:hypothetical protein
MPEIPPIEELAEAMIGAAKASLGRDWSKARAFAEPELDRLARTLVNIGEMAAAGEITPQEAAVLIDIHKNTTRMVILTVRGLGLLAAENAINAALAAVKAPLNAALGIALL